jgi:polyisoprenyl-phosphate glycosyltransferase
MQYSIILPVYNEDDNIHSLYARIKKVLEKLKSTYEIIFVNDGSNDRTQEMISALHKKDSSVKLINFSRQQ